MKIAITLFLVVFFATSAMAQWNNSNLSLKVKPENQLTQVSEKSLNTITKTAAKEKDFTFAVNPYFWTVAIGGIVGLPNAQEYHFNVNFTDAVKDLKMAAMVAGRFKYKSISLMYDMFYVKLNPNLTIPAAMSDKYVSGSSEFKEFVSDITLGYRFPIKENDVQLDVYGGVRVWSTDNNLNLTSPSGLITSTQKSNTWVDPVFGAYINFDINQNWFTYLKGDMGGFGVGSTFTTTFVWGGGYRFDEHWNTSFGLKSLYIDYNKEYSVWNVWQSGLLLSAGYRF